MKHFSAALICLSVFTLSGCNTSQNQVLSAEESQVKLRSMQTRAFDATDRNKMHRTVIATLQDLGFVVDHADETLGSVTGTKVDGYAMRMTVTVRQRGTSQLAVRANAQYNLRAVESPEPYQQYFEALSKALFLTAHEVD